MSAREASAGDAHGGTPTRINIDVNASGQREQWVYDDGYLYLDDGVLATIQCRNIVLPLRLLPREPRPL